MSHRRVAGFTLVELMVSLALAGILLGIVYAVFIAQRRGHVVQEQVAEMQQNARVAADQLGRALLSLGNNVDRTSPPVQSKLLYCGPYEVLYNSDVDTTVGAVASGTTVYSYTAPATYATGAETYRFSLDKNRDGVVDTGDLVDGRHYALYQERFWGAQSRQDEVARNLTISDTSGTTAVTRPLFVYYGDFDGTNTTTQWTGSFPITDLSGNGRSLDEMVRRIAIVVRTETRDSDPQFAAYRAVTGGYRQSVVQSNLTPRNLWDCPLISGVTPVAETWAVVQGGSRQYQFNVSYENRPFVGTVTFALSSTVGGAVAPWLPTLVSATTVSTGGVASATVTWPTAAQFANAAGPYRSLLAAGANLDFILTATLQSSATPLGDCGGTLASIPITITPAPANRVQILSPLPQPAPLTTCSGSDTLVYQAVCTAAGVSIPADLATGDTLQLKAYNNVPLSQTGTLGTLTANGVTASALAVGAPLSTVTIGAAAYPYAVRAVYQPPVTAGSWPTGAATPTRAAPGGNDFLAAPAAWISSAGAATAVWSEITLVVTPSQVQNVVSGISSVTHSDCTTTVSSDTFELADCHANPVYSLPTTWSFSSYLNPTTGRGSLTGPTAQGLGSYKLDYTLPQCVLGPPAGQQFAAQYGWAATGPAGASIVWPTTFSPSNVAGTGQPINLTSCGNCVVTFVNNLTPCTRMTPIQISNCSVAGDPVAISVVASGSAATWGGYYLKNRATGQTGQTVNAVFDSSSLVDTVDLYVPQARAGDTFTITATYTKNGATWTCTGTDTVDTQCSNLTLENLNPATNLWESVDSTGGQSCLSKMSSLRVTVDDCQQPTVSGLGHTVYANRYPATVYLLSDDGTYLDKEGLDLVQLGATPTQWRNAAANNLIVEANAVATWNDGHLTYPPGKSITLVAAYKDTSGNDPNDDWDPNYTTPVLASNIATNGTCRKVVELTAPIPVCFPNAITSGGGGGWNGNFNIHWGDVVIRGDVELAAQPKFLTKSTTGQFNGADYGQGNQQNSDRFFDIYVGKNNGNITGGNYFKNNNTPVPNASPSVLNRPFLTGNEGAAIATDFGNYYRNISNDKINSMMRELDYTVMRNLALERGVYWYTVPGTTGPKIRKCVLPATTSGLLCTPVTTPAAATLEAVISLPSVGGTNALSGYNGEFIFIDTYGTDANRPPDKTSAAIDATTLASFPTHKIGGIYTEGIVYVAGSIDWAGSGGGKPLSNVKTPPGYDMLPRPYRHNDLAWAVTENDLPIRPDPGQAVSTFNLSDININGAFYMDGEATFSGSPRIYGAISAERGFKSGGNAEVWYNYNLNVSEQDNTLCVNCCTLRISPSHGVVPACGVLSLSSSGGAGAVDWTNLSSGILTGPSVAIGASTTVTAGSTLSTGNQVMATDSNNCPAFTKIDIVALTLTPSTATVPRNTPLTLTSNAGAGNTVTWSSTGVGGLTSGTGLTNTYQAGIAGTATVSASIGGCTAATATITVLP